MLENLPLASVRVLDLTRVVAGPFSTKQLADLGAEVIKVESIQVPDETRYQRVLPAWPDNKPGSRLWNSTWYFNNHNCNKLGITVDIGSGWGQDIIRQLVKISDVVAENYRPGVLEKVGLQYDAVKAVSPDIIMLSLSGFGNSGPYRKYRAYGTTVEFMSGLASLTGYPGGPIVSTGQPYGDWCSAMMGAVAILMALHQRRRTGHGQYIDLSESEVVTSFIGDALLGFGMNGAVPERSGNRHPSMAPHGIYPCSGQDRWVAISVEDDDRWAALCSAMGRPDLVADSRFASVLSRKKNEGSLDEIVAAWTSSKDSYEAFHLLQAAGVAAGPVANGRDVLLDPQLRSRGYFQRVHFRQDREMPPLDFAKYPIVFDGERPGIRFPAPDLGEQTDQILGDLLGFSGDELEVLRETQITGNAPLSDFDFSPTDVSLLEGMGAIAGGDLNYRERLGLDS